MKSLTLTSPTCGAKTALSLSRNCARDLIGVGLELLLEHFQWRVRVGRFPDDGPNTRGTGGGQKLR